MKRSGITSRIVVLICVTVCCLCAVITTVGSRMIYSYTESGVESEVQAAAKTLKKLYDADFIISTQDADIINIHTNQYMTIQDFNDLTALIGCSSDIDFTLFRNDTRYFTSVKNADGSTA